VLTTDQKGNIAEVAISLAAIKLGIDVYWPVGEGGRYDLILDLCGRLNRVQCKWATRHGEVVIIRCYSCRRTADGLVRRGYSAEEIDVIAGYCLELDTCYLIPFQELDGQRVVQLRLGPTRNNQKRRIRWARDFEFVARLGAFGAVAQLGERESGTLEVTGSSPVGSTFTSPARPVRRATT
jgi:hypothetical protein